MDERDTELRSRLVVGHKGDGRRVYDPEAKRALIERAMRPGVSVARLALDFGINANLLRAWIGQSRRQAAPVAKVASGGAFIPVLPVRLPAAGTVPRLSVVLGNGVKLELTGLDAESLPAIFGVLSALPCSDSTGG